ncbi:MAG: ABC transporter permease [Candidatus Acidiferrales bacterium]
MNTLWQDLKYATRMLIKAPAFTAFAVGVLALGIAANTSIFSFANAVLLRSLPYHDADRLTMLWEDFSYIGFPANTPAPGNFYEWKAQNHSFDDMAATYGNSFSLTGGSVPEEVEARQVTWNLFAVLGVKPALGRDFSPDDDRTGANHVVMISHALWSEAFAGDPQIVGKAIELDGAKYSVIGVMPAGFEFREPKIRVWVPAAFTDERRATHDSHYLQVVGRLKPGVSLEQANADLAVIAQNLAKQYPTSNAHVGAFAVPLREDVVGNLRVAIFVLLGAVGFVLLIACANVANLLLARATGRQRELALRMALGAGRTRIIQQLLTESVLLASLAGALGLLLTVWGAGFLARFVPDGIPVAANSGIDARIFAFTLVVSMGTGILFGIIPALRVSRVNLNDALKQAGARTGVGSPGRRTRDVLVVVEVALAMILLTGAALMIESFSKLRRIDLGFRAENVLSLRVPLPDPKYAELGKRTAFYDQVLERVDRLPGVVAAGFVTWVPLTNRGGSWGFIVEGRPAPGPGETSDANTRVVTKDYFRAMGVTLKAGRLFDDRDRANAPLVAVVNDTMARQFWPGENPIGHRIKLGGFASTRPWATIVGITADIHQRGIGISPRPEMYYSYAQQDVFQPEYLAVKTSGDPLPLANAIRDQIWAVDKDQPVADVMPMQAIVDEELSPRQMQARLLGIFAGIALALASLGIYAVLSYAVAQRTQEIGVRMALGAQRRDVLRMVLGQGLALTLLGVACGTAGALALARVLATLLHGISATDPLTFTAVGAGLSAVALFACYVPARRAMRVDPIVALRYE